MLPEDRDDLRGVEEDLRMKPFGLMACRRDVVAALNERQQLISYVRKIRDQSNHVSVGSILT